MAVETIQIRGKKYPIKIGYFVMKTVKQETDSDSLREAFKQAQEQEQLEIFESVLFAALKQGAWDEEQELDLKREDMEMALGNCFPEFMKKFASGKFFPKDLENATAELEDLERQADQAEGKEQAEAPTRTK